ISLNSKAGQYELIIKDNGIGLPNNLDVENIDSLGLQLVNSLIDQLDADIEIDKTHGTKFIINFSELNYKKRI
ncbi:MAG: histidine kinase, partial [Methanobacteriaceae archaeon]|nr:histidine kinase [Methanobacteriaceae archaeon]